MGTPKLRQHLEPLAASCLMVTHQVFPLTILVKEGSGSNFYNTHHKVGWPQGPHRLCGFFLPSKFTLQAKVANHSECPRQGAREPHRPVTLQEAPHLGFVVIRGHSELSSEEPWWELI